MGEVVMEGWVVKHECVEFEGFMWVGGAGEGSEKGV